MRSASRKTWIVALAMTIAVGWATSGRATVISFNATGGAGMGMSATAGAPGVNVSNWNDMAASGGLGTHSGSINNPLVCDGSTATGTSLSWTFQGFSGTGGVGSNDALMYSSEWDPFGTGTDVTITVTNIPYLLYNVHVYLQDSTLDGSYDPRGGDITANGVNRSLNMFNNTGEFVQYFESTDPGPYTTASPKASYVRMSGLSGDLTLTLNERAPGQRLRFSGFQIEEAPVPEPATWVLLSAGGLGLLALRRRKRTCVAASR